LPVPVALGTMAAWPDGQAGEQAMGSEDQAMNGEASGPQAAPATADAAMNSEAAADAALSAIGYEAADPSLLASLWGDDIQAPRHRHLR
jgi:hypothetical protein